MPSKIRICFLATYLIIGFYVFVNIINFHIWLFNPSPTPPSPITKTLDYPPLNGGGMFIPNSDTYRFIHINVNLRTNTSFTAGEPIIMEAYGSISHVLTENLTSIFVSFNNAQPYSASNTETPHTVGGWGVSLSPAPLGTIPTDIVIGITDDLVGRVATLEWQSEGDYYPTLSVQYWNGTTIKQAYMDMPIHIQSDIVIKNERYTQIGLTIAIGGFILGVLEKVVYPKTKPN